MNSTTVATTGEPAAATMADTSRVPPMVFVDDEGLEEQFLMEDEMSQEVMDVTANQVITPVEDHAAPLNLIYMQRSQRGPICLANALDQFLDDNYKDVLHNPIYKLTLVFLLVTGI